MNKVLNILFLFIGFTSQAQQTRELPAIELKGKANGFSIGTIVAPVDSNLLAQNSDQSAAEVLHQSTNARVINYGAASLSTISVRGSSTNQVVSLWHGMPINGVQNGVLDYNLLPAFLLDHINIEYGSNSTQWGSGAIGAAIHLSSDAQAKQKYAVMASVSNAKNLILGAQYCSSKNKWHSNTRIFFAENQNRFNYINDATLPIVQETMNNAQFVQRAFLNNSAINIKPSQTLYINTWLQHTDRNLQPNKLSSNNTEAQLDQHARLLLEYKVINKHYQQNTRLGNSLEYLRYQNGLVMLDARYLTNLSTLEHEYFYKLSKKIKVNSGLFSSVQQANSKVFTNTPHQFRAAVYSSFKYSWGSKLSLLSGVRQELYKGGLAPTTMQLSGAYQINGKNKLGFSLARHYRVPTLNDWYWPNGGNINLKSEHGWGQELNYELKTSKQQITAALYSRRVNDWILWLPSSNGLWSPENVNKVWSRGVDASCQRAFKFKKQSLNISLNSSFNLSTIINTSVNQQQTLGKQLLYLPMLQSNVNVQIPIVNNWAISYACSYTGKRFMTSDNSQFLPSFVLNNLHINKKINFTQSTMAIQVSVNNFLNANYEVIQNRPMPLRNMSLMLKWGL